MATIITAVIICCFTTTQQSAQYGAQQSCNIKAKNKCYTFVEKFYYLV